MSKIQNKKFSGFRDLKFSAWNLFRISNFEFRAFPSRGFTLIELLISVAMLGVITSFVLLTYSRVSGQLFLTTLAYEIALSFREAQSYGVSVRGTSATNFTSGYGLHFEPGNSNSTYIMFADSGGTGGNKKFDGSFGSAYNADGCIGTTECMTVFKTERGNSIAKICGVLSSGNMECSDGPNPTITSLDVAFLRPNPDAIITTSQLNTQYRAARVYIQSPTGEQRIVEVTNTGQISVR